jgi:alanine racemase
LHLASAADILIGAVTEPITDATQRTWVDIDLGALVANARAFQAMAGAPLLPMVKADAYGLGAVPVARALERVNPWGYGVATVEEGRELRQHGIARPILVFTPLMPFQLADCLAAGLRPCIGDAASLEAWVALSEAPFHLEIDTGMRRSGIPWDDAARIAAIARVVEAARGWEGIFTHFHSSESDLPSVRLQWARLHEALRVLGRVPQFVHAANSGAGIADLVLEEDFSRPGIYLYGGRVGNQEPHPVAAFRARVVAVRRIAGGEPVGYGATWRAPRSTTIATVAAGYADGLHRSLSRRGSIEIGGRVHPIAGPVTMDLTMVDVGDLPVRVGDVATIFGGLVSLDDQAAAADTIGYELLATLGRRVIRRYRDGGPHRNRE